ncbi:MAG: hypothetical protein IT477_10615 [Rhodanobacteraceae bacterium]|nr:hypothetical protein [Rhodanobacteraceae bacterium]
MNPPILPDLDPREAAVVAALLLGEPLPDECASLTTRKAKRTVSAVRAIVDSLCNLGGCKEADAVRVLLHLSRQTHEFAQMLPAAKQEPYLALAGRLRRQVTDTVLPRATRIPPRAPHLVHPEPP